MSTKNPERIRWRAPTENTDGSPINYELAYELYVDGTATATFPGRLNEDGSYSQDTAELFPNVEFGTYKVGLKAFRVDQPNFKSALSNEITYSFDRRVPEAPFLLD